MLAISGLIPKLQEIMPAPLPAAEVNDQKIIQNDAGIYSLYGDPAYFHLFLLLLEDTGILAQDLKKRD
jgi:hypothetical protein